MAQRIVVTGASGFIGRSLVAALMNRGDYIIPVGRGYYETECDVVYHLACPSTTAYINEHPREVMDIIMDGTRQALNICPSAVFVNASSMGALDLGNVGPQRAYNVAKRCVDEYLLHVDNTVLNYHLPSVYGPGMSDDAFIKRCVMHTAHYPTEPDKLHYIAHVDDVVDAFLNFTQVNIEEITLGEIYEQFNSGRRGICRPTLST